MRIPVPTIATVPLIVLLCACASARSGSPDADVDFEVEPDEVAAGDSITLELENDAQESVSYNLCSSGLEMETDGAWQDVPSSRMCTRELRILQPGAEATFRLQLPSDLAPGTYRFYTGVQMRPADSGTQLRSETFRVRR